MQVSRIRDGGFSVRLRFSGGDGLARLSFVGFMAKSKNYSRSLRHTQPRTLKGKV